MKTDPQQTITKACLRALRVFKLTSQQSASVLSLSAQAFAEIETGSHLLDDQHESWSRALEAIALYDRLATTLGDDALVSAWLHARVGTLGGSPADLIQDASGMQRVLAYARGWGSVT